MPALEDSEAAVVAELNGAGFQIPTDAEFAAFLNDASLFATAAQGALADTALQPGANISTLTNDAGFLTSAPVVSVAGLTGTVSSGALVTALGLDIGTDVQAYDANLPTWPATVSATEVGYLNGVTSGIQAQIDALVSGGGGDMLSTNNLSDLANAATARSNLGVAIGSDVQAYDANLPAWPAAVSATELGFLDGVTSNIQAQIDGIGGGAGGDAWGDPVDANITFAANNTYTIGTDAARAAGGHFETLNVAGEAVTALADPPGDRLVKFDATLTDTVYSELGVGLAFVGTTLRKLPEPIVIELYHAGDSVVAGDRAGDRVFTIPTEWNGLRIASVEAYMVTNAGTGVTTMQVHNITNANDILSTQITIDDGELGTHTAATPPVVDGALNSLSTGDQFRFDVDAAPTDTAPEGLCIVLNPGI